MHLDKPGLTAVTAAVCSDHKVQGGTLGRDHCSLRCSQHQDFLVFHSNRNAGNI